MHAKHSWKNPTSEFKKSKLFQAFHKHYTTYEFNKIIEISKSLKKKKKPNKYIQKDFHKIRSKINQY